MPVSYNRPLHNNILLENFLTNILGYKIDDSNNDLITKIVAIELNLYNFDPKSITLHSKSYRHISYRDDEARIALRKKIIQELITTCRLKNDEMIRLGKGGALPKSKLKLGNNAYVLIGLPASGKSRIANDIAEKYGAIILDCDYAKRKIPEYYSYSFGASLVHEESSEIVFGINNKRNDSLLEICGSNKINIVIPKIGSSLNGMIYLFKLLKNWGYYVHLTLVELNRKESVSRALKRFVETDRYVPLSLIFDCYANDPTITYYKLKGSYKPLKSYGIIDANVARKSKPKCVESINNNPAKLY